MSFKKPKTLQDKVEFGLFIFWWVLVLVYYVFLIFGGMMFGAASEFYRALNLFSGAGNPNIPIRIASYVFFIFSISYAVRLALRFLSRFFHKGKAILNLVGSLIKYVAVIVLIFLILNAFNVDPMAMMVSAGVVSLIIGLGAQSLIGDVIAGLFIVFEETFQIGDIVVLDDFRGTVKEIGIRTTQIEDWGGNIKIVNNSDIRSLINMTNKESVALIEVDVDYRESLERVEAIIKANLDRMKAAIPAINEGPFYIGVSKLGASGVTLKFVANCLENNRFQVERDMMREIKIIFDENNVSIPFPQIVINQPGEFAPASQAEKKTAQDFVQQQHEAAANLPSQPNEDNRE